MGNKGIYFDIDERLKIKFLTKCIQQGLSIKKVLGDYIKEFVKKKRKS